jgi:hypothetical protein
MLKCRREEEEESFFPDELNKREKVVEKSNGARERARERKPRLLLHCFKKRGERKGS